MLQLWKTFLTNEDGGPAIEFAVVATFIAISIPAIIDIADIARSYTQLSGGMRAATQYALKFPDDNAGIAQAVASASGLPVENISVTTVQFCECSGLIVTCETTCGAGVQLAKYSEINMTYTLDDGYTYGALYPDDFTNSITVRIQ